MWGNFSKGHHTFQTKEEKGRSLLCETPQWGFRNLKKKQYNDVSNIPLHDITFESIVSIHTLHKKGKIACRNNRNYLQAKIKFQEHTFLKIFQPTVEMIFFFKIVGGHHQMTFGVKFSIVSRFYTFKIDISKIGITEKNPKDFIVFFVLFWTFYYIPTCTVSTTHLKR